MCPALAASRATAPVTLPLQVRSCTLYMPQMYTSDLCSSLRRKYYHASTGDEAGGTACQARVTGCSSLQSNDSITCMQGATGNCCICVINSMLFSGHDQALQFPRRMPVWMLKDQVACTGGNTGSQHGLDSSRRAASTAAPPGTSPATSYNPE